MKNNFIKRILQYVRMICEQKRLKNKKVSDWVCPRCKKQSCNTNCDGYFF